VHQLVIKVLDIVDARCNHEPTPKLYIFPDRMPRNFPETL